MSIRSIIDLSILLIRDLNDITIIGCLFLGLINANQVL